MTRAAVCCDSMLRHGVAEGARRTEPRRTRGSVCWRRHPEHSTARRRPRGRRKTTTTERPRTGCGGDPEFRSGSRHHRVELARGGVDLETGRRGKRESPRRTRSSQPGGAGSARGGNAPDGAPELDRRLCARHTLGCAWSRGNLRASGVPRHPSRKRQEGSAVVVRRPGCRRGEPSKGGSRLG